MNRRNAILIFALGSIFYFLFYRQNTGLNVLIFESILLGSAYLIPERQHTTYLYKMVFLSVALSAVFVALYASDIAFGVNVVSLFFLMALRMAPELRAPDNILYLGFMHCIHAPRLLSDHVFGKQNSKPNGIKHLWFKLRIFLLPVLVLLMFLLLYLSANSKFNALFSRFTDGLSKQLYALFSNVSFAGFAVFLLGVLLSSAFLFKKLYASITASENGLRDDLLRVKKEYAAFKNMDLKKEYLALVFLLSALNVLIFIPNIIDINWIWFNYTWNGSELKEFVHAGTYILILAIVLSGGIAVYIFRGNLNFYPNNALLKVLSLAWIIQNMVMTVSVGMRTYRYIQYFNLAYLRIGLLYFLAAVMFVLLLIMLKIMYRRSNFYLSRLSFQGVFILFFLLCPFDWDSLIVRYNIKHAGEAYFHSEWNFTRSDKTLRYVYGNPSIYTQTMQVADSSNNKNTTYKDVLSLRKSTFLKNYGQRSWQAWNYADWRTYQYLKAN